MMVRLKVLVLLASALWCACAAAQPYYMYIANESEDTVVLVSFDGHDLQIAERIPVGNMLTEIEGPHGLTVSPDGRFWFVSMAHGQPFGKIVRYSTTDNRKTGEVTVGLFPASMAISPLTGLPVSPAVKSWRVVAVKFDNSVGARPQSGLSAAGVVYEHVTEGSVTRYTAFFLDSDLERVGPIRSSRFVDRDLVQQFDALFAHVGASPPVMQDLRSSPAADVDQFFYDETRPYFRVSTRPAPFNMYASLPALREVGAQRHPERREIEGFRFYEAEPEIGALTHLTIPAGPRHGFQSEYVFDTNTRRWRRSLGGALDVDAVTGQALELDNVIAQWVPARVTQYDEDSLGNKSVWIGTTGEGPVSVFRDGTRLDGTWRRPSETDVTEFLENDGSPIELRPGRTWIHLLTGSEAVEAQ